jgi:sec-independent protein translocase protein TatA
MGLKMSEILLILAALLLLFGASRLPQLGTSLGSAIRNFKKGFGGEGDEPAKGATPDATGKLTQSGGGATTSESDKVASKQS